MLNTLGRLSKSLLALQQYRDAAAKTVAAELKPLPPDRDLVQAERAVLLDRADELFGFKSAARPDRELEPPTPTSAPVPAVDETDAPAPAALKSEISNLQSPAEAEPPAPSLPVEPAPIQIQKSKIKNTNPPPEISDPLSPSATEPPAPAQPVDTPPIEIQKSKIENPNAPGHCPACNILLPPLLKNGERPVPVC